MTEFDENFITTYTGRHFHYLAPSLEEINIQDIAHSLSLKCRFSGHCKELYSVGEHSLRVSDILPAELQFSGLLHDATEAYMPDIARPIKERFGLKTYEYKILKLIQAKFGTVSHPSIKKADNILLATEKRDLMPPDTGWKPLPPPLWETINPMPSEAVELLFLYRFRELRGKDARRFAREH